MCRSTGAKAAGPCGARHTTHTVCHSQGPPDTPHRHLSVLLALLQSGKPFFGICLGMQLLFDGSDESGGCEGLGLIKGKVRVWTEGRGVTNQRNQLMHRADQASFVEEADSSVALGACQLYMLAVSAAHTHACPSQHHATALRHAVVSSTR